MSVPPTTLLVHLADQRRARTDSHGIINFSIGLVRSLPAALGDRARLVVLVNDELAPELAEMELRPGDEVRVVPAPHTVPARLRMDHRDVGRHVRSVGADVVMYPKGFLPLLRSDEVRHVVCLHDDIPWRLVRERSHPPARRARAAYFSLLLRHSVRAADQRLFVSSFTESQLTRSTGHRAGDRVVHEGITLPERAVVPLAERAPQAVVFGSALAHKRSAAGLGLLAGADRRGVPVERVVVVGHLPPVDTGDLAVEHRPGPLPGADLADLVARSRLLVYPSEYEGFGLPPVEALALGTPVVHRSTEAGREVLGDVPGRYDDESPHRFQAALAEALALDDDDLERLSADFRRRHDWDVVARGVVGAILGD